MSSNSPPASASSVKKLAIRGTIWTLIGYGSSQVIRFGSNLILTRLLAPDLFGLMGLVYVFISGLHLFSDIGINANIIQSKRGDDPKFLNTAWTLQVLRGIVIWLGCVLVTVPAAQIYKEPQLMWLIPIVGLNTVISGFNSMSIVTLNRHLSVKQLAIFELVGQVLSISIMLVWAAIQPSVWALVVGGSASAIYQLIASHRLNQGKRNYFMWDRSAVKELISFGQWIFLSTIMTFLSTQADRLILGTLFTFSLLGVYNIAFTLSDIPRSLLIAVSSKVLYPVYSKLSDLPRPEFREKILRNRAPILVALALMLAMLVGFGDVIVRFLYTEAYSTDASWMLPLLALGMWPIMLTQTIDPVLFALGKPKFVAFGSFLSFLCYAIGIPLGFHTLGAIGAVLAVASSNVLPWLVVSYALTRERLSVFKQDIVVTTLFLAILSVLMLVRMLLNWGLPFEVLLPAGTL